MLAEQAAGNIAGDVEQPSYHKEKMN